jgi:glycosyltransferase involved in cell wall biosynthesis
MRIYVYPGDRSGCGLYRLIWPAEEMAARGHDVHIKMPHERNLSAVVDQSQRRVISVNIPDDADVMVFQRLTNIYMARAIPFIIAAGVAVVVDQDDDLARVNPTNPAYKAMHPSNIKTGRSDHSWEAAQDACDSATLVTVSAPALLKRYATVTPGMVLRNMIPAHYLDVNSDERELIGWPAIIASHANDATRLGGSIARLINEGYRFATIGDPKGIAGALRLSANKSFTAFGPKPIEEWPETLAQLGVGLAPLDYTTEFNQSKSWLKPLELAACGVPVVMSPGREYLEINKLGVGVTADKPNDFYTTIKRLLKDRVEYDELKARGREVARGLTIPGNVNQWVEAWEYAYKLRQEQGDMKLVDSVQ